MSRYINPADINALDGLETRQTIRKPRPAHAEEKSRPQDFTRGRREGHPRHTRKYAY